MIKLDDNLLTELGLQSLPAEEKRALLKQIYETLEMRVGTTLARQMTDAQLDEFESFINSNDEAGALRWLETNFPNYKDVVAQEFDVLKGEIRQAAPQIVASAAARQQQMMQQQPMQAPAQDFQQQPQAMPQQMQQPVNPQDPYAQQQYAMQQPQPGYAAPQQQPQYQQPVAPQQPMQAPAQDFQQQPQAMPQQPYYGQPQAAPQQPVAPIQPQQPSSDQSQFGQAA